MRQSRRGAVEFIPLTSGLLQKKPGKSCWSRYCFPNRRLRSAQAPGGQQRIKFGQGMDFIRRFCTTWSGCTGARPDGRAIDPDIPNGQSVCRRNIVIEALTGMKDLAFGKAAAAQSLFKVPVRWLEALDLLRRHDEIELPRAASF